MARTNYHRKQAKALRLLASGATVESAAAELKLLPSTLHRWCDDEAFSSLLASMRRARAVATLHQLASDESAPPDVRLLAATEMLAH